MENPNGAQLLLLAATLLTGLALGCVYDFLRVLRARRGSVAGFFADAAFCLLFGFAMIALGMGPAAGTLRLYMPPLALCGTLVWFNLFGKTERSTKIFMGDSGSLSLGFTLGFLAVKCTMDNNNIWPYRPEAIIVPLTLLFVPTADVVRVTLYRLHHHKPLFDADKNHIHHKIMRTGLNQHQALVCILMLAALYIVMNSLLYMVLPTTAIVIVDIVFYCIVNMCINHKMKATE